MKLQALAAAMAVLVAAPALAQDVRMPRQLVLATDREGGVAHTMGSSFSATLTKHSGTRSTVLPVGDPAKWVGMMRQEEVDIGLTSVTNLSWAYWGTQAFAGKPNKVYTLLALGAPSTWGFMIPADAPVKNADDLKKWMAGKRLSHRWVNPVIDHLNLSGLANLGFASLEEAKLTAVPVSSYQVFVSLWNEQRVDVIGTPTGIPLIQQMFAARPGKFMPMYADAAAVARMQKLEPSYYVSKAGSGVLGVEPGTPLLTFDYSLVGRNNLDNAVVRRILESLYKNEKELTESHATVKGWFPVAERWATVHAPFPFHPGAVEFYKSVGLWNAQLEAHQAELVRRAK